MYWHPPTAGAYLAGNEYAKRSTLYNHGLSPRESLLIVADSFYFAATRHAVPGRLLFRLLPPEFHARTAPRRAG
jgi:hypothetical protein